MSIFSWLMPKTSSEKQLKPKDSRPDAALSGTDPLKSRRQVHREQLYQVVREVMLRAEVLAASYKFKVLSLDGEGRQYLIMIDLLKSPSVAPELWLLLESKMIRNAATHHSLVVKAVYWRPGVETPAMSIKPTVPERVVPTKSARNTPHEAAFEPICTQEMLAFKNALTPVAAPEVGRILQSGARLPAAAPGFEDTELMEPDDSASPLSRTQYGDL